MGRLALVGEKMNAFKLSPKGTIMALVLLAMSTGCAGTAQHRGEVSWVLPLVLGFIVFFWVGMNLVCWILNKWSRRYFWITFCTIVYPVPGGALFLMVSGVLLSSPVVFSAIAVTFLTIIVDAADVFVGKEVGFSPIEFLIKKVT